MTTEEIALYKSGRKQPDIERYKKEYDPKQHEIFNILRYPDRTVVTDYTDEDGVERKRTTTVPLNRIGLPFQQEITTVAVTFLFGKPVTYVNKTEDDTLFDAFTKLHDNLKMQYIYKEIAENCSKFTECAILTYVVAEPNDIYGFTSKGRIYIKLLTPDIYKLYPVFDANGKMTSFGREFTVTADNGDKKTVFEVYTENETITFTDEVETNRLKNDIGKIPVVYFSYPETEWEIVQPAIERLEAIYSNAAESNDRFAFPILKLKGKVTGQLSQDKSGRVLQLDENADADFAQQPNATESLEKEIVRLEKLIRSFTATPDFSFENIISVANIIASGNGASMFIGPHLKAMKRLPMYISNFKRQINVFIAFLKFLNITWTNLEASIGPQINLFKIDNEEALVKFAMEANGNQPVYSQEYSMKIVGVKEPEKMIAQIQEEANKRVELTNANDFAL